MWSCGRVRTATCRGRRTETPPRKDTRAPSGRRSPCVYRDAAGGAHEQAAKIAAQMQAGPQARWLAAVLWAAERMREGPAGGSSAWSAVYRYAEQGERGLATPEGRSARLELLDHLYLQEKQGG